MRIKVKEIAREVFLFWVKRVRQRKEMRAGRVIGVVGKIAWE